MYMKINKKLIPVMLHRKAILTAIFFSKSLPTKNKGNSSSIPLFKSHKSIDGKLIRATN